ncbi:hypothetical protein GCM10009556_060530 [Acrocarpospora pleiomorpha]
MLRRSLTLALGLVLAAAVAVVAQGTASAAPAPGTYTLVNGNSGQCLDVLNFSTADNASLIQFTCTGGTNQRFTLATQGSGFRLAAAHSGKCLGVVDASTSAGKAVQQQSCTGATSQTWTLTQVGSLYRVVNVNSAKCLNIKDSSTATGAIAQQNSCDSVTSKQWTFAPAGSTPPVTPTPTPTPSVTPTTNPPLPGWPSANGQQAVPTTISVSGTLDGGMRRYYGTGDLGSDSQDEDQGPIFQLANGATLRNVILGAPAADGIHCMGTCTLQNVWWEDVGEDAATFRGSSSSQTMTIDGGGARLASDKVFQHNGPGTMYIRNFQFQNIGKVYRSCGNCSTQHQRNVVISNITVTRPAAAIAGINTNYGDTARISGVTIVNDPSRAVAVCEKYRGTTSGEPTKIGSGADGVNCIYSASDITYR